VSAHDVGEWFAIYHEGETIALLPERDRFINLAVLAWTFVKIVLGPLGALAPWLLNPLGVFRRPRCK